jgi:hypothetical protein
MSFGDGTRMSSSNPDDIHPSSAYKQPPAKRDTVHAISIFVILHWSSARSNSHHKSGKYISHKIPNDFNYSKDALHGH